MAKKDNSDTASIHVHIYRGVVDSVEPHHLREPVELWIFDDEVMFSEGISGTEISIYRLNPNKREGGD